MPHTEDILPGGRYAVVSCHAERPLDDRVWGSFARLQEDRPGGFRIAALLRPPDETAGEDEHLWLERAREATARGPVGLHTHWTAPDHARPTGGDPAALVREQIQWLRERRIEPVAFCGGGWYMDEAVASVLAELRVTDCTATAFRPEYLPAGAPRLHAAEPAYVELPAGGRVLELPTTHGVRRLARSVLVAPLRTPLVHAYFHDTDLLAVAGLFFVTRAFAVLAILLAAYQTAVAMIFVGVTRYRVPWDFLLAVLASAAILELVRRVREARRERVVGSPHLER